MPMKFSNNIIVLPVEKKNGWHQCRLRIDWWDTSSDEETLEAMVDNKCHMSLMCPGRMVS